jgi:hypothetical protein
VSADLDGTTLRLVACLHAAAATVVDEAPPWDPAPRLRTAEDRRRRTPRPAARAALAGAALIAAVIAAVISAAIAFRPASAGTRVRARIVAAAERATAAHTARLQVTSDPIGGPVLVGTGLVDFDTPAYAFTYADGFGVIAVGARSWRTEWPPVDGRLRWVAQPGPTVQANGQPWPNGGEADLAAALEPDTAPSALVAALRADTTRFTDLGGDRTDGIVTRHYRATQGPSGSGAPEWQADVWIAHNRVVRLAVRSPTGRVAFDYSDYGVPVAIAPPTP